MSHKLAIQQFRAGLSSRLFQQGTFDTFAKQPGTLAMPVRPEFRALLALHHVQAIPVFLHFYFFIISKKNLALLVAQPGIVLHPMCIGKLLLDVENPGTPQSRELLVSPSCSFSVAAVRLKV